MGSPLYKNNSLKLKVLVFICVRGLKGLLLRSKELLNADKVGCPLMKSKIWSLRFKIRALEPRFFVFESICVHQQLSAFNKQVFL